ncbi:hypothetical protein C0J52_10259 [Blattella germanica]|nr:hypothetical protein C0J52_10259 [Blattella germanica]
MMALMRDALRAIRFQREIKGSSFNNIVDFVKRKPMHSKLPKLEFQVWKVLDEAERRGLRPVRRCPRRVRKKVCRRRVCRREEGVRGAGRGEVSGEYVGARASRDGGVPPRGGGGSTAALLPRGNADSTCANWATTAKSAQTPQTRPKPARETRAEPPSLCSTNWTSSTANIAPRNPVKADPAIIEPGTEASQDVVGLHLRMGTNRPILLPCLIELRSQARVSITMTPMNPIRPPTTPSQNRSMETSCLCVTADQKLEKETVSVALKMKSPATVSLANSKTSPDWLFARQKQFPINKENQTRRHPRRVPPEAVKIKKKKIIISCCI